MGREFELKYQAGEGVLERLREEYGPFREIRMETTYYDDAGKNISLRRWTLRRRLENGVSVCTVKTTLPDGSRGEWETEAADVAAAIPRLIALGAPAELADFAGNGLVPVCGARFTRLAALLPAREGLVELALDEGVLLGGGRELPFREVEVEQKRGPDDSTRRFAAALAQRFSLTPQPQSKLQRAKGLLNSAPRWGSWQAERPD